MANVLLGLIKRTLINRIEIIFRICHAGKNARRGATQSSSADRDICPLAFQIWGHSTIASLLILLHQSLGQALNRILEPIDLVSITCDALIKAAYRLI